MTDKTPSFFEANRDAFVLLALGILVLAVYAQATGFQYINLDDNNYAYGNEAVMSGLNWRTIQWAFTTFHAGNWHPLTWLSLALDVQLFGGSPGIHHAINVVLHLLNSVVAFLVFRRMTGAFWASAVIAALFAVHPTHVESVAWVSERKDLLSTAFWLLTMWFYVRWVEEGARQWNGLYAATLAMFVLGCLSKPMVVTLPFVLLLCDIWPLGRTEDRTKKELGGLVVEKIPFFALSALLAIVTVAAQRTVVAVESIDALPLGIRIENAVLSYAKYVLTAFYPARLGVWYPYDHELGLTEVAGAALLLLAITAVCIWQFRERKYLLFGWLWFLGTLVPVIGIVQVGGQSMADRYTYVPYFGLFVMIVFGASDLFRFIKLDRRLSATLAIAAILTLAVIAHIQTSYWRDSETLYTRTLAVTGPNFLIEHNYCYELMVQKRLDEAEAMCRTSLEHNPNNFGTLNTLGLIRFQKNDYAEAEALFARALTYRTAIPLTFSNLALAQILQGRPAEGEANLQKAVELSGSDVPPSLFFNTLVTLVDEYLKQGNSEKAVENLRRLRYIQPNSVDVRLKLADTLIELKQFSEARAEVDSVLNADPRNAEAWNALGKIMLAGSQNDRAREAFEKAVSLRPDYEEAKDNLKRATAGLAK